MADFTVVYGGVETLVELGGTPSASTVFAGGVEVPVVADWATIIRAVVSSGITGAVGQGGFAAAAIAQPGNITTPMVLGYTLLGIVSIPYKITGGITFTVVLDENRLNRKIPFTPVLGGGGRIRANLVGTIQTPIVLGGSGTPRGRVTGGIQTFVEMGGTLRDGFLRGIESAIVVAGALRVDAVVDDPVDAGIVSTLIIGQNESFAGGIETPVILGGFPAGDNHVTGGVTPTIVVGAGAVGRITARQTNPTITTVIKLGGGSIADQAAVASEDTEFANTGQRRMLPLIAYVRGAHSPADIRDVPYGKAFTVAENFADTSGVFYESGAGPGYVGFKMGTPNKSYYVFRAPLPNEVLWMVNQGNELIRFIADHSTGKSAWKPYRSWPQRALDGLQVIDTFDPDRVYNYYATILGAMMAQLQRDNATLTTMYDAGKCPREYLPALATTLDAEYDAANPEPMQRQGVATSVASARRRGFPDASVLRMRTAGYKSNIFEVWAKIGWPTFSTSRTDVAVVTSTPNSIVVLGYDQRAGDLQGITYFRNSYVPETTEWVDVTRGTTKRFYFGAAPAIPVPGSVVVPIGTAPNVSSRSFQTMESLVTAINAWQLGTVVDGVPGIDHVMLPHSYHIQEPLGYWASRFVTVIINQSDGTRLYLDETEKRVLRTMLERALPVAARVKSFGTAAPMESEGVGCTEVFAVTAVAGP